MKRSIGIYIIAIGLLLNGIYLLFETFSSPYFSSIAWALISIVAAFGVFQLKK